MKPPVILVILVILVIVISAISIAQQSIPAQGHQHPA
jgi:hypothetical protein